MLATEKLMINIYGIDFRKNINSHLLDSFQEAQKLEKEQIISSFENGMINSTDFFIPNLGISESECYYKETYKNF